MTILRANQTLVWVTLWNTKPHKFTKQNAQLLSYHTLKTFHMKVHFELWISFLSTRCKRKRKRTHDIHLIALDRMQNDAFAHTSYFSASPANRSHFSMSRIYFTQTLYCSISIGCWFISLSQVFHLYHMDKRRLYVRLILFRISDTIDTIIMAYSNCRNMVVLFDDIINESRIFSVFQRVSTYNLVKLFECHWFYNHNTSNIQTTEYGNNEIQTTVRVHNKLYAWDYTYMNM